MGELVSQNMEIQSGYSTTFLIPPSHSSSRFFANNLRLHTASQTKSFLFQDAGDAVSFSTCVEAILRACQKE